MVSSSCRAARRLRPLLMRPATLSFWVVSSAFCSSMSALSSSLVPRMLSSSVSASWYWRSSSVFTSSSSAFSILVISCSFSPCHTRKRRKALTARSATTTTAAMATIFCLLVFFSIVISFGNPPRRERSGFVRYSTEGCCSKEGRYTLWTEPTDPEPPIRSNSPPKGEAAANGSVRIRHRPTNDPRPAGISYIRPAGYLQEPTATRVP